MSDLQPFDCGARPRVLTTRGGIVESEHFARYAIVDAAGELLESGGDVEGPTFMRSSAKPLIAATVIAAGAADRYGLTDEELAVAAGSHSGEPYHLAAVRSILAKIGLEETALACGPHPPLHAPSAAALAERGEKPSAIHNNCSGKHAAILALAMHRGAGPQNYLSPDHPAEREILDGCAELLAMPRDSLVIGIDGCGIPAIAVPLRAAAAFYAKLSGPKLFAAKWAEPLERVRRVMLEHPEFVGGTGRFDTALMRAASPHVLCKGGAEGYHATAALKRGIGMCVKIADGNNRAIAPFVIERLSVSGVLTNNEAARLEGFRRPQVTNHAGTVVGEIISI